MKSLVLGGKKEATLRVVFFGVPGLSFFMTFMSRMMWSNWGLSSTVVSCSTTRKATPSG